MLVIVTPRQHVLVGASGRLARRMWQTGSEARCTAGFPAASMWLRATCWCISSHHSRLTCSCWLRATCWSNL
jgi:hypothetical protein